MKPWKRHVLTTHTVCKHCWLICYETDMGPEIPTAAADQNFAWICKQHQDLIGSVLSFRTKIIWSGPEFGLVRCGYLNAANVFIYFLTLDSRQIGWSCLWSMQYFFFFFTFIHVPVSPFTTEVQPGAVARSEASSLGMQEAPSSIPTSGTFFRGDLVMQTFLRGHSPSSADSRRGVFSYWRKNVH